jgi:hypothetical protein
MVTPPDLSKNLFLLSAVLLPVFEDKKGSFATTASREVQRVDRLLDFFSLFIGDAEEEEKRSDLAEIQSSRSEKYDIDVMEIK